MAHLAKRRYSPELFGKGEKMPGQLLAHADLAREIPIAEYWTNAAHPAQALKESTAALRFGGIPS
jgi:hypothetical protein